MPLRHVHADVGDGVGAQEVERPLGVAVVHPAAVAELDADRHRLAPLLAFEDVAPVSLADRETTAGTGTGSRRAAPRRAAVRAPTGTGPRPRPPRPGAGRRGRCSSCPCPDAGPCTARRVGRVLGEQRERLDVEPEGRRGAGDPQLAVALVGRRVVGRVHLDQRELLGVVGEPVGRALDFGWVPAGGEQRPVCPRSRAHEDLAHAATVRVRTRVGRRGAGYGQGRGRAPGSGSRPAPHRLPAGAGAGADLPGARLPDGCRNRRRASPG